VYVLSKSPIRREDGDVEVLCDDLQTIASEEAFADNNLSPFGDAKEEIVEDRSPNLTVLEAKA